MAALVHCLEARREEPCPDTNDLALSALDCLHKLAPRLQLAPLSQQRLSQLMSELCQGMAVHDNPLRVRVAAAGVIQRLALETQNLALLATAAGLGHVSTHATFLYLIHCLCVILRVSTKSDLWPEVTMIADLPCILELFSQSGCSATGKIKSGLVCCPICHSPLCFISMLADCICHITPCICRG